MTLSYYSFEESYLLAANYLIGECKIILRIDARMSTKHPLVNHSNSIEEKFQEIEVSLSGVQYFRGINSKNLLSDPNEDIGSIHSIEVKDSALIEKEIIHSETDSRISKFIIDFGDGTTAEIYSKPNNLRILDFISEMIAFRAAFEEIEIRTIK